MKKRTLIYTLIAILFTNISVAQKVTYHNKQGTKVSKSKAVYYKQISKHSKGLWKVDEFYMDSSIAVSGFSSKKNGSIKQGEWIWYFKNENGNSGDSNESVQIKSKCSYSDNKRHGETTHFYSNGVLKEKTIFHDGYKNSIHKYYRNGQLKSKSEFKNKIPLTRLDFYENGQIKNDVVFELQDDLKILIVKSYYDNGNLLRDSRYMSPIRSYAYKFLSGNCYDENGNKIPEITFMRMALFPGGTEMLRKYISSNVKYPKNAAIEQIQGKVYVSYIIDKEGDVIKPSIARSDDWRLDEEALRVVRNMPRHTPGIRYGELVTISYTIPINFRFQ